MKNVFFVMLLLQVGIAVSGQVIPVDSASYFASSKVIVYGTVTETFFNYEKRKDTCVLMLSGPDAGKNLAVKISPEVRSQFGYRPEKVLLYKTVYVQGKVEMDTKGQYQLMLASPFDISLSKRKMLQAGMQPENMIDPSAKDLSTVPVETSNIIVSEVEVKTEFDERELKRLVKEQAANTRATNKKVAATSENQPAEKVPAKEPNLTENKTYATIEEGGDAVDSLSQKIHAANDSITNTPDSSAIVTAEMNDALVGNFVVLASSISLKGGPGNFFTKVGSLKKGEKVKVISCSFEWCKIEQAEPVNGKVVTGYVNAKKLKN